MRKDSHHNKIIYLLLVLFFIPLSSLFSQQISLKAKIDSSDILIGDWINYSLVLTHSEDIEVIWPAYTDTTFGDLEIINQSNIDTVSEKGKIIKSQTITLTAFDSGQHTIPALPFLYKKKKDTNVRAIITDTFLVNVNLIKVDTSKAIKPIKAPITLPLTFKELVPYILAFIALSIIGFLIYYYIRKRKNKPILVRKEKPKIPAHIVAIEKLKKLENEKLWQKGETKRYHTIITEIVREYIEGRFSMLALESTTEEILENLKKLDINQELLTTTQEFFELSDIVKFAKMNPLPNDNERCMHSANNFISQTKPKPPVADSVNNK